MTARLARRNLAEKLPLQGRRRVSTVQHRVFHQIRRRIIWPGCLILIPVMMSLPQAFAQTSTPTPALSGLTYNGGTPFVNGTNLTQGQSYTITAQANTSTKSVVFRRDGSTVKTDSAAPFDFTWTPTVVGSHTYVITPWSLTGADGTKGASITVNFNVVASNSTPTP